MRSAGSRNDTFELWDSFHLGSFDVAPRQSTLLRANIKLNNLMRVADLLKRVPVADDRRRLVAGGDSER